MGGRWAWKGAKPKKSGSLRKSATSLLGAGTEAEAPPTMDDYGFGAGYVGDAIDFQQALREGLDQDQAIAKSIKQRAAERE